MSYPINYPTPQGANIQIFQEGGSTSDWVKPQGASFVWFTLIGAGGGGGGSDGSAGAGQGGGSGAVTNCMVPAFLIPDSLQISIGNGGTGGDYSGSNGNNGTNTLINYISSGTYNLLTANAGSGGGGNGANLGSGGTASASNYFSCMGFFQSIAGQNGSTSAIGASSTTFLNGGSGSNAAISNYGYQSANTGYGYFQIQPIIVGLGGGQNTGTGTIGGIGCGGGGASLAPVYGGNGGNGLVVIITW
jgi:hypothetical protein